MRLSSLALCALAVLLCLAPREASAQPIDPEAIPPALREYVPWVLADDLRYGCTRTTEELVCAWPGTLELARAGADLRFSLELVLDREGEVFLPGGDGQWPVDVEADGKAARVLRRGELAYVILDAGAHRLEGVIRFGRRPESLRVPSEIARVFLVGERGARTPIERAGEGVVTLDEVPGDASEVDEERDSVSLEVVRQVTDGVPMRITTQVIARVSGRPRAISLGRALVAGSVPSRVEASVPVQVSPEGELVLQVHGGTHQVRVEALVADPRADLKAPRLPAPWPEREIWVFAPEELYRQVDVEGVSSIDPQSPSIPPDWRSSAAFTLEGGDTFQLVERRRGDAEPAPNAIRLDRTLWLDFDGRGFTARDHIGGSLTRAARLDLEEGRLGRVTIDGEPQLITMPPGEARAEEGPRGVEIRKEQVRLVAELRLDASPRDFPAVGWSEDVRGLSMRVNLPPGHTLFAARGVDDAPNAWLSRWDVGPLFLVLLITVIIARLYGVVAGVIALVTLVLAYHEAGAPRFAYLFVLVPAAALGIFARGRFAQLLYVFYGLAFATLAVMAAGFVSDQFRYAAYPQLYTEERVTHDDWSMAGEMAMTADEASEEAMVPQAAPAPSVQQSVSRRAPEADADAWGGVGSGRGAAYTSKSAPDNWIDPNAVVQMGYGVVDWSHSVVDLHWSGSVDRDHRVQLYLVRPWLQRIFALARALGLIALVVIFFRRRPRWPTIPDAPAAPAAPASSAPAAGAVVVALLLSLGALSPAHAQVSSDPPSPELLAQLRERLLRPPACGDRCAQVGELSLKVEGESLRLTMTAHVEELAALPLPGPATAVVPSEVRVDGALSNALRARRDGYLELRLTPGVHRVELLVPLRARAALALSFFEPPGRVAVNAPGWTVSGVDENGVVRGTLELRRQLDTPAEGAGPRTADVPVWVEVHRHVDVGVQWLVQTTVRRLSSTGAPAVVRIPAMPGEVVLGDDALVVDGHVVVTVGQGAQDLAFTSRIPARPELSFTVPTGPVRAAGVHQSYNWSYQCSPLWHCTHEGLAPIRHAFDGASRPTFAPYPGEILTLAAARLEAAPGPSLTIDAAELIVRPGVRSTESVLSLEVKTSVSNTLVLGLPEGAEVDRLLVEGAPRPVELRDGKVRVGVVPSTGSIELAFTEPHGMGVRLKTPRISVDANVVDVDLRIELPKDRWLLGATGPSWGPIVLFWGYLALVVFLAFLLGRVPRSPLATYEWALLALGLLVLPLPFMLLVASWFFFVLVQHERKLRGFGFNVAQVALLFHALLVGAVIIAAAWVGLTERPDMRVVGNGSHGSMLHFYQDRVTGVLPVASVWSVSLWVWKGLMLAWAFWLARALVRWVVWAVRPFADRGFFEQLERRPVHRRPVVGGGFGVPVAPEPGPEAPPPKDDESV